MTITIFGASGRVGKILTQLAIERGHKVIAFTHSGNALESAAVTVIKGDVHNQSEVSKAIKDADAVISALGSWGTHTKDILGSATKNLIPALESKNLRFVTLTGNIASPPNEKKSTGFTLARAGMGIFAGPIIRDADEHLRLLAESKVRWTSVRSPVMTNGVSIKFDLTASAPLNNVFVSRRAVAVALLDLVESEAWIGQAPTIIQR